MGASFRISRAFSISLAITLVLTFDFGIDLGFCVVASVLRFLETLSLEASVVKVSSAFRLTKFLTTSGRLDNDVDGSGGDGDGEEGGGGGDGVSGGGEGVGGDGEGVGGARSTSSGGVGAETEVSSVMSPSSLVSELASSAQAVGAASW